MTEQPTNPEQPTPTTRKRTGQLSGIQIMFAAILAIGLLLAINFSTRITAVQPLQEAYRSVELQIEGLEREQAALIAERDWVQGDIFVELWARDEGGMVRPGEVLVYPVPSVNDSQPDLEPTPVFVLETSAPPPDAWMVWWALFFDSPPPNLN